MHAYLTIRTGVRAGANYALDPTDENLVGRGLDCDVVLTDPLCSRVHARILRDADGWFLYDSQSRNGCYVNGQKADEARLADETLVRLGSTEMIFRLSDLPLTSASNDGPNVTQTIIRDVPIELIRSEDSPAALPGDQAAADLLLLHQLSLKMLGAESPDAVVDLALGLLQERTKASIVGFLWVNDEGELRPKKMLPEASADRVQLSESLTDAVYREGKAVWIDTQMAAAGSDSLRHYADAICVPLRHEKQTVGAVHVYAEQIRFDESDFEFAISVGNTLAVSLVRTRLLARLQAEHSRLVAKSGGFDELLGESKPMRDLKSKISRIARATGCVLVRGESGSGKELVARAIHRASARSDRPMLSVNCAAIPSHLMESHLFGHRKGAFTGAEHDHVGWFEQADSGTLFLDEVGEMTLDGQAKLLRILEGHSFLPVGATQEVRVDVRVIAATNRDLREFVAEKRFREDLYYRLSVFELYIPPLRERGPDIRLLIDHFLDHFRGQHGRPNLQLSSAAYDKLLGYRWPGNVRQLRNVIDSAVVLAEAEEILPDDLGLREAVGGGLESLKIDHWERKLIQEALGRTSGNVPQAAKLLGIGRATLYRKLEEYGIKR